MTAPTCVNLQDHFGWRYRVGWEAAGITKGQWPAEDHPWLMELRCRYGIIHPFGGEILCAVVTDHPGIAGQLRRLGCIQRTRGDLAELRAYFHLDDAEQVFRIMQPYRRRQVSEAERARLQAMGVAHRFKPGVRHGLQSESSDAERTQTPDNDAGHGDGATDPSTSRLGSRSEAV